TVVPIARPPELTMSKPVLDTVAPDATPLAHTVSMAESPTPLPITRSPKVVPPADVKAELTAPRNRLPPPCTAAPDSTPPRNTLTTTPVLTVVPLAVPPEKTAMPPLLPGVLRLVLLTMVPIARPPELTKRRTALLSVAPEAVPPLRISTA